MAVIDGIDLDALNYTVLVPYNGTEAQGANPLKQDVNIWYQVSYHRGLYVLELAALTLRLDSLVISDG